MTGRGRSSQGPKPSGRERRRRAAAPEVEAFERWLREGLAPDERDLAAGSVLAAAWRDRRRAAPTGGPLAGTLARRWAWAPLALVAVAVVALIAWPATPVAVDGDALAHAYLDAMGALPLGDP